MNTSNVHTVEWVLPEFDETDYRSPVTSQRADLEIGDDIDLPEQYGNLTGTVTSTYIAATGERCWKVEVEDKHIPVCRSDNRLVFTNNIISGSF